MWKRLFAICLTAGLLSPIASGAVYTGNGEVGFGGPVGGGSLELTQLGTSSTINGLFTRGAGDFNDALVLYIDSGAGGFTDTSSFTDTADGLRNAISGFDGTNRSTVNFSAGFGADQAIAISTGFGGLWTLSDPTDHTFGVAVGGPAASTDASFTFSFDLGDLGLAPGDSFDFVGTYLNPFFFRSDEAIGDGVAAGNPGNASPITFTGSRTFTSAVPEPSSLALLAIGGGFVAARRRRK